MEKTQRQTAFLCAYTRAPRPGRYPAGLARSLHLAWSPDGEHFTALHHNCGVLYIEGEVLADDTIAPKGIKAPWIFSLPGGSYGIAALRVNEDGRADARDCGSIWLWRTRDFICFSGPERIALPAADAPAAVRLRYNAGEKRYHLLWTMRTGIHTPAPRRSLPG